MAKDITLSKLGSVNGSGTKSIGFDWGRNTSRSAISRTYTVEGGKNRLFVSQSYAALNNVKDGVNSKSVVSGDTDKQVTFNGKANGRYLRYSVSGSISATVSESSGSSSVTVGTTYTSVNNFLGGTQMYGYSITVTVPHNTAEGDYSVTVDTSDSDSPTSANMSVTYTVNVTESAISVTSVDITESNLVIGVGSSYKYNDAIITVDSNSRNQLHYTVSPENASIRTVEWTSSNPEVATVDQNGLVTGVLNGIITGTTTITCTVTDENGGTASDMCSVTVYAYGTITLGGDITIPYNSTSGSTSVAFQNIDSLSQSDPVEPHYVARPWLANMTYDSSESRVYATRVSSDQVSLPEPTTVYVTGLDRLGNTVQSNTVSVSQQMVIRVTGPAQIGQNLNHENYSATYLPFNITGSDKALSWSFNSPTATDYATISNQDDSGCTVSAKSGADNDQVTLVATNTSDNSIRGQYVIWVTYREAGSGTITAVPTEVNLAYDATSDNSVTVTVQNAEIAEVRKGDNFLTNASLNSNTGILTVTFPANNETVARTDSVHITSVDGIAEPAHIIYTQAARPNPSIEITKLHANTDSQGYTTSAQFEVKFKNNTANTMTYTIVSYELLGRSSSDTRTIWKQESIQNLSIEVGSEPVTRVFTISDITSTGVSSTYTLDVTATLSGATGSASDAYSGDGTDVIS